MKITLRAARVNRGLTQTEAASEFGIHRDTLYRYEADSSNVPRKFVMKVEEVYGIPVDYIFFGKESDFFRNFENL
jgi:transcriptional regulator with XRE-family HTH domain